jgi:hypothetical protein
VLGGDSHHPAAHLADRFLTEHLRDGPLAREEDAAEVHRHDRLDEAELRVVAEEDGFYVGSIDFAGMTTTECEWPVWEWRCSLMSRLPSIARSAKNPK